MATPQELKNYEVKVSGFDIPEAYLKFSIDWSRLSEEMAKEIVGFHADKDDLAFEADDDTEQMLVLKTSRFAYFDAIENDHNARGVNRQMRGSEGWPVDGEIEFQEVSVDQIELRMDDLSISSSKGK